MQTKVIFCELVLGCGIEEGEGNAKETLKERKENVVGEIKGLRLFYAR